MRTLETVVGGQFGSEAKGHVVQRLAERASDAALHVVRVAGPNAGHTGHDSTGQAWALRQVPVAAVIDRPVILGIAPGSEIDLPVLLDEYDRLNAAGLMHNKMLWVSSEATMIYDEHKDTENSDAYGGDLVARIGSTGKGIGAARSDRLMRTANRLADDQDAMRALADRGIPIADPRHRVADGVHDGGHLIIEGTQGFGLGLRAGFYPQCTSSDCRAVDFQAMAGVNPQEFDVVTNWVVARVYPIRVAGNSGPLNNETTWAELGLPEEYTTVTKKVRRVGHEDWALVADAVRANGGSRNVKVALTMFDQKFPFMRDRGYYDPFTGPEAESQFNAVKTYLDGVQYQVGAEIALITTGPNKASFL